MSQPMQTDAMQRAADPRLLTASWHENEDGTFTDTDGRPVDSLAALDWRDYESAVRSPAGGGR
jgi:hypothetical protein